MPKSSLVAYLEPSRNEALDETPVDYVGRFLLPLDAVWFELPGGLMIPGRVLSCSKDRVVIEPELGFCIKYNLEALEVPAWKALRAPSNGYIARLLKESLIAYNRQLANSYYPIYINGVLFDAN